MPGAIGSYIICNPPGGGGSVVASGTTLSSGIVASGFIGNEAVVSGSYASGSISRFAIASGSLLGFELGSGAIVSGRIASGQVGNNHLSVNSVWSGHVGSGTVIGSYGSGRNIASGSIGGFDLASGVGAGGSPGGTSGQVQFHNGVFGGLSAAVTTDGTGITMTSPRVITGINDTNGNELIKVTATASAVNELTVANAATGGNPVISATGGDTSIGITLTPKSSHIFLNISDTTGVVIIGGSTATSSDGGFRAVGSRIDAVLGDQSNFAGITALTVLATSYLQVGTVGAPFFNIDAATTDVVRLLSSDTVVYSWLMQAGHPRLVSNITNATTTMANLTELSVTVKAGRKYTFKCILFVADDVAADGVKVDFDGGTATMTSFRAHATIYDTALLASAQVTAIATDFSVAVCTGDALIEIHGAFVCNAGGTFIPRAAQVAHTTGTLTVYLNSFLTVEEALT